MKKIYIWGIGAMFRDRFKELPININDITAFLDNSVKFPDDINKKEFLEKNNKSY